MSLAVVDYLSSINLSDLSTDSLFHYWEELYNYPFDSERVMRLFGEIDAILEGRILQSQINERLAFLSQVYGQEAANKMLQEYSLDDFLGSITLDAALLDAQSQSVYSDLLKIFGKEKSDELFRKFSLDDLTDIIDHYIEDNLYSVC